MTEQRILLVEDNPTFAQITEEGLRELGHEVLRVVSSAERAIEEAGRLVPDLVLMDIDLTGAMDGIEAAMEMRERYGIPVVFLTGHEDEPTLERASLAEPYGYLIKPFDIKALKAALEIALYRSEIDHVRAQGREIEDKLLEETLGGTVQVLTEILSTVEHESFGRGQELKAYIAALAEHVKINQTWDLEIAAMLSSVGYVSLPSRIIDKVRSGIALNTAERSMRMRVPEFGRNLLSRIPRLEAAGRIVYYQNKDWDGRGFPYDPVAGPDIPLGARMLRILSDILDHRHAGTSKARLIDEMRAEKGKYDSELLEAAFASVVNPPPKESVAVALIEVKVGHVLISPIETEDGMQLVSGETNISSLLLEKLRNYSHFSKIVEPIYVRKIEKQSAGLDPGKTDS